MPESPDAQDARNASDGEFELIRRLTQYLPANQATATGVGDDCAVLDVGGANQLLATCDSQVEGVHFLRHFSTPEQIGRKALAVNLSDIAAMGGLPRFALVSLILPHQSELAFLQHVYAGLQAEAAPFQLAIVGGNVSGSGEGKQLIIDITLLGEVEHGRALLRSGARAGDLLYVTGLPGESAAGLATLSRPELPYPSIAAEKLRARYRTPTPRLDVGRVLQTFGPEIITALLDISDGVSGDLAHLCESSRVGARLFEAALPLSEELQVIARIAEHDPLEWFLHGGEDYELLFSIAPDHGEEVCAAVQEATGVPVTVIGVVTSPAEGLRLERPTGVCEELVPRSWDHLKPQT